MHVAVQVDFKADRREPLGDMLRRIAAQFEQAGLELTPTTATFSDGMMASKTSAIDRALKKYPHLAAFLRDDAPLPNMPSMRRLTSQGTRAFAMEDVIALADGMPRSLPFHAVIVQFRHADFDGTSPEPLRPAPAFGVIVQDSWWVNGRTRNLSAAYSVDVDAAAKKLPDPPASIRPVLDAFGKPRNRRQLVVGPVDADEGARDGGIVPKIAPIVEAYRSDMQSLLARIPLPHDLPPAQDVRRANALASGPLKPALVEVFAPRGFDCKGGSGIFTLQRRTASHNVVELDLDVGTWSRSLSAFFRVRGPGFKATLQLPVVAGDRSRQYPIGDSDNWRRIVDNLAAVADELDRTFVKEIEAVVGPAPAWFDPGRE